jgi:hypothetical protein
MCRSRSLSVPHFSDATNKCGEPSRQSYASCLPSDNVERHTRSKVDDGMIFEANAAVHVRLNHLKTMPVALNTLWEFKVKSGWSGEKTAAYIFNQLCMHRQVEREVEKAVEGSDLSSSLDQEQVVVIFKSAKKRSTVFGSME